MLSHQSATKNPATAHPTPNTQIVQVTMNRALPQPVCFAELMPQDYQIISTPGAIYVESFNEIFTEVEDKAERKRILSNLNDLLGNKHLADIPCFLDIGLEKLETCIRRTARYLGSKSNVADQLSDQGTDDTVFDFKADCEDQEIDTLYIGGVFGRACVWSTARRMAENVYATQLGDGHPNIRFVNKRDPFRFKHAVIDPSITQGYQTPEFTFSRFLRFPENQLFEFNLKFKSSDRKAVAKLDFNERKTIAVLEDQLKEARPGISGEDYETHFSERENPTNHQQIYSRLQQNHQCVGPTPALNAIGMLSYSQLPCCFFANATAEDDNNPTINQQPTLTPAATT